VKRIIDSATTADLREGDVWYIVESSWWEIWTNATGYASLPDTKDHLDEAPPLHEDIPPINNAQLVYNGGEEHGLLKMDRMIGEHFVVLPKDAWQMLHNSFGGAPVLQCPVVADESHLYIHLPFPPLKDPNEVMVVTNFHHKRPPSQADHAMQEEIEKYRRRYTRWEIPRDSRVSGGRAIDRKEPLGLFQKEGVLRIDTTNNQMYFTWLPEKIRLLRMVDDCLLRIRLKLRWWFALPRTRRLHPERLGLRGSDFPPAPAWPDLESLLRTHYGAAGARHLRNLPPPPHLRDPWTRWMHGVYT
jgi:hypothetical protein